MNSDRLSLSVTHADGSITRWGPDEVDAENIPGGLRFGTSIPGGFKDLSCSLLRRVDLTYQDQALFDTVRVYAPGGRTVWEGRMQQFPRQHGTSFAITPGAIGWSAHLKDDPSLAEIYVDRDLGRWGDMSRARRLAQISATPSYTIGDTSVAVDDQTGLPAVIVGYSSAWTNRMAAEALYDAGPGLKIGAVYYDYTALNIPTTDANWSFNLGVSSQDDLAGTGSDTGDLHGATSASGYFTPTSPQRYGFLAVVHSAAATANATTDEVHWRKLTVYGAHGLPRRGSDPGGLYASDVVADIVRRAAPLLTYTTGAGGSIEATTFAIPHLVFADPVTAEDAILATNAFHQWEWGVYDAREFFYRPPDPARLTWQARLDHGAQLDLDGLAADDVYNGVFVHYQDPAGQTHTVGPPGSTAEATDPALADTSEANPVNAHGIPRRWAILQVSQTTTQAGATQIGAVWLVEQALSGRRGSMVITATVTHPTMGERPVYEVRAGDFIEIADHPDTVPRRIIETSYDHQTRSNTLTLDNTVHKLDSLFERLGAGLIGVI